MIRGWGKFTWGMTVEEVEKIDPNRYWDEESGVGYRQLNRDREIDLFDRKFTSWLRFKKSEGLDIVKLTHENSGRYEKDFVFKIFNVLKAKYGQGSSLEYEDEEASEWGYPVKSSSRSEGSLVIEHIWYLEETIIKYRGSWSGKLTCPLEASPASLYVNILYSARGAIDYDQL